MNKGEIIRHSQLLSLDRYWQPSVTSIVPMTVGDARDVSVPALSAPYCDRAAARYLISQIAAATEKQPLCYAKSHLLATLRSEGTVTLSEADTATNHISHVRHT
jgi:hypothetical protein